MARSCGDANACRYGHFTVPALLPHVPRSAHAPQRSTNSSEATGANVATASYDEIATTVTARTVTRCAVRQRNAGFEIRWSESGKGLPRRFGPRHARRPARGWSSEPLLPIRDRAHQQLPWPTVAESLRSPATQLAATSAEQGRVPRWRRPKCLLRSRASAPRLAVLPQKPPQGTCCAGLRARLPRWQRRDVCPAGDAQSPGP